MENQVGIVTFHRAYNYGAILQVYALKNTIEKLGKKACVVDYYNNYIYKNYKLFHPFRKNIVKYMKDIFFDLRYLNQKKKRINCFEKFINSNLNLLPLEFENELECVITGSDQVWNYNITGGLDDYYTLNNFQNENIKKISYAASVGDSSLILNKEEEFKEKISKLDYISVREEETKEILSKIITNTVDVVLDPTLLLDKSEWIEKTNEIECEKEKYIFAYVVEPDNEYIKIVNELSKRTNLKVIYADINNPGYINGYKSMYSEGPMEFVNYIKNAEYIVTTSFHATVFSVIFNKNFWVVPHKKTGARVTNLLKKLNLMNQIIYTLDEFEKVDCMKKINYEISNEILNNEKEKSIDWLNNAINN